MVLVVVGTFFVQMVLLSYIQLLPIKHKIKTTTDLENKKSKKHRRAQRRDQTEGPKEGPKGGTKGGTKGGS